MARSVRGSAVGKKFDKGMTKHVCAKALDQAVQEGWLVQEGNYVRARPNQETLIHGRFVPTSFAPRAHAGMVRRASQWKVNSEYRKDAKSHIAGLKLDLFPDAPQTTIKKKRCT